MDRVKKANRYTHLAQALALLAGSLSFGIVSADTNSPAPAARATATPEAPAAPSSTAPPASLPRSLQDIVRLVRSGIDDSVVVAFVQTAPSMPRPSADDLLNLREAGVSPAVLTALLKRPAPARPARPTTIPGVAPAPERGTPPAAAAPPTVIVQQAPAPSVTYLPSYSYTWYASPYWTYRSWYDPWYRPWCAWPTYGWHAGYAHVHYGHRWGVPGRAGPRFHGGGSHGGGRRGR